MAIATLQQGVIRTCTLKNAVLSAAGIIAIVSAPNAVAEKSGGAPITYAGHTPTSGQYAQYASAPISSTKVKGGSKRVEYRYPDQPNMSYSAEGPRQVMYGAAPIAFASSSSAVTLQQAQKVSGTRYVAPRAFDAGTKAASVSAQVGRSAKPMRARGVKLASTPPKGYAKQKIGAPYEVQGRWYVPFAEPNYDEVGTGSWYGPQFHGKASAVGEVFDQNALTAAHPTLPIPCLARVTNLENGRTVVVRINDRGPFVGDRVIDLSKQSATVLGYKDNGTAKVRVQYMGYAPKAHNTIPAKYVEEARRTLAKYNTKSKQVPVLQKVSYKPVARPIGRSVLLQNNSAAGLAPKDGFILQVGAFGELANAHQLRAKLHPFGEVSVKETRIDGREMFRVYVGAWSSREQALRAKSNLASNGYNALIVSN